MVRLDYIHTRRTLVNHNHHYGRHIDGHDYMWAVSELLDKAQEAIFILVSTLFLATRALASGLGYLRRAVHALSRPSFSCSLVLLECCASAPARHLRERSLGYPQRQGEDRGVPKLSR